MSPLEFDNLWCGFRPHWAGGDAPQPINATVEKVATSPYFRGAFAHHRCLVPQYGWYEWLIVDGRKQPHYLTRGGGEPLWFAGIWMERSDGKPSCAILTKPARGVALGNSLSHERLTHWPVRTPVNKPVEDGPALIEEER